MLNKQAKPHKPIYKTAQEIQPDYKTIILNGLKVCLIQTREEAKSKSWLADKNPYYRANRKAAEIERAIENVKAIPAGVVNRYISARMKKI